MAHGRAAIMEPGTRAAHSRQNRPDMKNDDRPRDYRKDTLLTHLGRNPEAQHGAINPPAYHASTILSKNIADWENRPDPRVHFRLAHYGLSRTPTPFRLHESLAQTRASP